MNINPVDGNIVGWGNDFWAGKVEYGGFEHRFAEVANTSHSPPPLYISSVILHTKQIGEC
jgi:hypothetical protein